MNDLPELRPYLPSRIPWRNAQPVQGFMSERSRVLTEEFLQQVTMGPLPVRRIVPTRHPNLVSGRYTLKLTWSLTRQGTGSVLQAARFTQRIPLAIRAHVYSLMREWEPWFSIDSIETSPVSSSSQM